MNALDWNGYVENRYPEIPGTYVELTTLEKNGSLISKIVRAERSCKQHIWHVPKNKLDKPAYATEESVVHFLSPEGLYSTCCAGIETRRENNRRIQRSIRNVRVLDPTETTDYRKRLAPQKK